MDPTELSDWPECMLYLASDISEEHCEIPVSLEWKVSAPLVARETDEQVCEID